MLDTPLVRGERAALAAELEGWRLDMTLGRKEQGMNRGRSFQFLFETPTCLTFLALLYLASLDFSKFQSRCHLDKGTL